MTLLEENKLLLVKYQQSSPDKSPSLYLANNQSRSTATSKKHSRPNSSSKNV